MGWADYARSGNFFQMENQPGRKGGRMHLVRAIPGGCAVEFTACSLVQGEGCFGAGPADIFDICFTLWRFTWRGHWLRENSIEATASRPAEQSLEQMCFCSVKRTMR